MWHALNMDKDPLGTLITGHLHVTCRRMQWRVQTSLGFKGAQTIEGPTFKEQGLGPWGPSNQIRSSYKSATSSRCQDSFAFCPFFIWTSPWFHKYWSWLQEQAEQGGNDKEGNSTATSESNLSPHLCVHDFVLSSPHRKTSMDVSYGIFFSVLPFISHSPVRQLILFYLLKPPTISPSSFLRNEVIRS